MPTSLPILILPLKRLETLGKRDEHWTGSLGLWIQILALNQVAIALSRLLGLLVSMSAVWQFG